MYRLLCIVIAFFFSSVHVSAIEKSPSVFYPLPTQAQGKIYAAKQLFIGDKGGIWIHDVHGKVRFFDGQNILPRKGSLFSKDYQQLTYLNNAFWLFDDGALYKTLPSHKPQKMITLPAGTVVNKIGVSGDVIWLVSREHFYTFNSISSQLDSYSLAKLSYFDKTKRVIVNDAKFGIEKWVLATNSGVFISEGEGFKHVPESGNEYVESLFFSQKRRKMLIGTLDGVRIIDLKQKGKSHKKIAQSHVLSMAETENEYWIGTENGLFVYSLLTGITTKLKSNVHTDYSIKGRKIFSLVNDSQGGIWIASEKGVFYYPMFGQKFSRFLPSQLSERVAGRDFYSLDSIVGSDEYLLTTGEGVIRLSFINGLKKSIIYDKPVNDSVLIGQTLWLARDTGLTALDIKSAKLINPVLPFALTSKKIDRIEADDLGVLWGTSANNLWSFNTITGEFIDYGEQWIVDAYLPATITQLLATKHNGIIIGTEHGSYSVNEQKITFNTISSDYGQSHYVLEDSRGDIWFASDYGIYKKKLASGEIQPISLAADSISPKCLMETPKGIWLASSQGLTLYDLNGDIKKHFGEPYGLINNEFLPGVCSSNHNTKYPQLVIGSTQGLVSVFAEELAVSHLPNLPIVISQIRVDDHVIAVGNQMEFSFDYGRVLSVMFSALPPQFDSTLEYQLSDDSQWLPIEGSHLTLDYLRPGDYQLYFRGSTTDSLPRVEGPIIFHVIEPWYMSYLAFIFYICSAVAALIFVVWWRSRLMLRTNRQLREQVELKTSQLRHQSKIVLGNNLQLRKQIQVRHTLLESILGTIEPRLDKLIIGAREAQQVGLLKLADAAKRELEQVKNIRSDSENTPLIHNLFLVIESVIASWKEEFLISGLEIETELKCRKSYIKLKQFNLDVIFNTLLSEAIKRLYKKQTLHIRCYEQDECIFVSMSDQGRCAAYIAQAMASTTGFALTQLSDLVSQSGGEISVFSSKEQNVVQLSWPCANGLIITKDITPDIKYSCPQIADDTENAWFRKVEQIVNEHYSDTEFSTTSVAKALFMSERSFQRRFKSATTRTFKEYLNEVRLEKACQRLLSGEKVSQVAFECGFNDPSYFSQRFRLYFGLSPTQFIDENQDI